MVTSTRLHFYYFICVHGNSLVSIVLSSIVLNRQPFQERPRSSDVSTPSVIWCYIRGGWYLLFLTWTFWYFILDSLHHLKVQTENKKTPFSDHAFGIFFTPLSCLIPPKCRTERHSRSFLSVAIRLKNCSLGG